MRVHPLVLTALAAVSCKPGEQPQVMAERADSAAALVQQYVERDARGERLATAPWFLSVVAWPEDPAFDSYTVITGFTVGEHTGTLDSVFVPVDLHRVGWIQTTGPTSVRFLPSDSTEHHEFRLGRLGGRWIIVAPRLEPHVLADTVLLRAPLSAEDRVILQALRGAAGQH
jgi:hypothetical protein